MGVPRKSTWPETNCALQEWGIVLFEVGILGFISNPILPAAFGQNEHSDAPFFEVEK